MLINQKNYINHMLKKFNMENHKESYIPMQPNHTLTKDLKNEKEPLRQRSTQTTFDRSLEV